MRQWYILEGPAGEHNHIRLDPMQSGAFWIVKVWTWPHCRGHGYGSHLLRTVCHEADTERVELRLQVAGFHGLNALTDKQLVEWYQRYGFVLVDHRLLMARPHNCGLPVAPGSQALAASNYLGGRPYDLP